MSTPILTEIEESMASAIEGLRKANGYYYDWGTVNNTDEAQQTFPSAEIAIVEEVCLDEAGGAWSGAYLQELTVDIKIRTELMNEESQPIYAINAELNKAVEDLKKLFGINYTISENCETIMYKGMHRVNDLNNDIFRPTYVIVRFMIRYTQDRDRPDLHE